MESGLSSDPEYILALKASSGVVSGLSIIGAVIVLLSHTTWCKIRENRQKKWESKVITALRYLFCDYRRSVDVNNVAHTQGRAEEGKAVTGRRRAAAQITGDVDEETPFATASERSVQQKQEEKRREKLMPNYHHFVICICISDILVAGSHIWGLSQNFVNSTDFIQYVNSTSNETIRSGTNTACTAQAVVTVFATVASFMWTLTLSVSLCFSEYFHGCTNTYIINACRCKGKLEKAQVDDRNDPHCCATSLYQLFLFPLLGWGIPAALFFALAINGTGLLGFTEGFDIAWCYLRFDVNISSNVSSDHGVWLEDFLGYELFVWGPLLAILVFFFLFSVLLCCRSCCGNCIVEGDQHKLQLNCAHVRYMLMAIVLVILRIPNTVVDIILILSNFPNDYRVLKSDKVAILVLIAGITNSAQGLANAFVFMFCTRGVGECCRICWSYCNYHRRDHQPIANGLEET